MSIKGTPSSSSNLPQQNSPNNDDENGKYKNQDTSNNTTDNEKPCCSKSLRESKPSSQYHVRFVCCGDKNDENDDVKKEFILENVQSDTSPPSLTPFASAISSHPHQQQYGDSCNIMANNVKGGFLCAGSSFSDTVLALSNLPAFENSYLDGDDDDDKSRSRLGKKKKTTSQSENSIAEHQHHHHHRQQSAKFIEQRDESFEEVGVVDQRNVELTKKHIPFGNISSKPPETNLFRYFDPSLNINDDDDDDEDGNEEDEEDTDHGSERQGDEREVDGNNNNNVTWPTDSEKKLIKHASYIFHKDRRADLERLTSLMPRGREYVVFNVFTDVARLFGYGRRKHVAFHKEFLAKYEQVGDVAGKDRFVPAAKAPYKGMQTSSKKRKLSAVYSSWTVKSAEFLPKMDRVDHVSKCEHCFEKYFIICDCCRCRGKKPDLTSVMEGFLGDLNLASLFLHGHATRTFESALSNMEFIKYHNSSMITLSQIPWATNYAKQRLGILSGSVWIFTYCIRTIIQYARAKDALKNVTGLPSEVHFRKIMEQYASICITMSENVKTVLQYSHNFYNFSKECVRVMKVLQIHIGFKSDLRFRPPLKRGRGLDLNKSLNKRDINKQKGIEVKVACSKPTTTTTSNDGEVAATTVTTAATPGITATLADTGELEDAALEWKQFEELSGAEKTACLRHLLNVTSEGMTMVQTQLRFLMDDIVDSVKDVNEADLLFLLADMFDRIKYLMNLGSKKVKAEVSQISKLMADFSKDFQSFMDYGHHIIKRFIELRDMIHLCNEFMVKGLKIEMLSEMVPASTFKNKLTIGCCGGRRGKKGKTVSGYQPKYKVLDFFRVYYIDAVRAQQEIYANKFSFQIVLSQKPIKAVIPTGLDQVWGGDTSSPRTSFDEYLDNEDAGDEDESILMGVNAAGDKLPFLKPIIASPLGSPISSPLGSPRGSIDESISTVGENREYQGQAGDITSPGSPAEDNTPRDDNKPDK